MVGVTSIYGRLIESYDHNNNDMHECILLKSFLVIRIELSENKQLPLNEFNLLIHILAVSLEYIVGSCALMYDHYKQTYHG